MYKYDGERSVQLKNNPLQIPFLSGSLYGILRNTKDAEKLVIICPAATGTRIGPQRIFVEIAQVLVENEIASFCVDFPPLGDSYDTQIQKYEGTYSQKLSQHYNKYLSLICNYFEKSYSFKELYVLSISDGCIPIYNFAKQDKRVYGLILLSPNHKLDSVELINKKNVKQYLSKILKKETWYKLFTLNLNFDKILKNIYHKQGKPNYKKKIEGSTKVSIPRLLTLFGEKEPTLYESIHFWRLENDKGKITEHTNGIIDGADHSFFGWQFKNDVEKCIVGWIKEVNQNSYEVSATNYE